MRRWIGTLAAAFLMAAPLLALQKAADEKGNDRTALFDELQKDFQKSVKAANEELQKVETQEQFQKVVNRLSKEYTARIIKLAESDPKDKVSGQILFWSINNVPLEGSKVYDLLADNWATDPRIKALCQRMAKSPNNAAEKLIQKVSEDSKDKETRAFAMLALGTMSKQKSEEQGDTKAAEQAEKLFERLSKEFSKEDTSRNAGPLAAQAKSSLEEIRKRGVGKKMPNLESENLKGKKVQLKDYEGKVVVLDIWATWCGPCKAMIPHERDMVEKLKSEPFALISISADAQKETLEKFLESTKMPWTHWWNGKTGGILKELEVQYFPTIYVLDGQGVIRYRNIRNKQLEEAVEKLLAEAKEKK